MAWRIEGAIMRGVLRTWWTAGEPWYLAVGLANLVLGTSSILIPLMVSRILGLSASAVGYLASGASLAGVLGSLVWGRLSDAAHRRKPFVVLSYVGVGASLAGIAFVQSFAGLLLLNMLLNFFWVANASVAVLITIENREQDTWDRKIGRMNQLGALGWVGGLILGSVALAGGGRFVDEGSGIRLVFLLIAALGVTAALLAARLVPRTKPKFTRRRFQGVILAVGNFLSERGRFAPLHLYHRIRPRQLIDLLRRPEGFRPGTKRFFAATFVSFVALGLFGIPLPLLFSVRFGMPSSIVFLYFAIQHVAIVVAYPLAARRIKRLGNRSVQMRSLAVRVILFSGSALFLALSQQAPATGPLVIAFMIYGFTWSYFQLSGVALISRLARPDNRGLALGLYNALAGVGWIVAGVGSGLLTDSSGYSATFAAAAILLCFGLLILHFVPDPVLVQDVKNDSEGESSNSATITRAAQATSR